MGDFFLPSLSFNSPITFSVTCCYFLSWTFSFINGKSPVNTAKTEWKLCASFYHSDASSWRMCHFACTSRWGSLTVWSDDQNQLSGVGFPGRLDEHHNLQNRKEASGLHSCGAQSQSMALHLLRPLWVTSPAQGYSCSKPYQNLQFPPPPLLLHSHGGIPVIFTEKATKATTDFLQFPTA